MLGLITRDLAAGAGAVADPRRSRRRAPRGRMAPAGQPHLPALVLVSGRRNGLRFTNPASQLARTNRLLLGLVFAFAVLWKAALSPDYRDGRFFAVTLRVARQRTARRPGAQDTRRVPRFEHWKLRSAWR